MLSQDHFYFGMIKKYIVAFSHIISDIHVLRYDSDGNLKKDIKVPTTYAPKQKLFYHLTRNSDVDMKISTFLPRISFLVTALEPDVNRKMNPLNQVKSIPVAGRDIYQYSSVPYNFTIEMNLWSMYMSDLLQIIEQVGTFFKPDYIITVNEIEELDITHDIPVTLNGIGLDIQSEFIEDDRVLRAQLGFTLNGFLYPPIRDGRVIEHIRLNMRDKDSGEKQSTINLDWDREQEKIVETKDDYNE